MSGFVGFVQFVVAHFGEIMIAVGALLVAFVGLLRAAIAIAVMIPGAEPETTLQKIADAVQKYVDKIASVSKK